MRFRRIDALGAPNSWADSAVLEVILELDNAAEAQAVSSPDFAARLLERLPELSLRCCRGAPSGLVPLLADGAAAAAVLEFVSHALQAKAGVRVPEGWSETTGEELAYRLILPFEDERLGRACLESALALCSALAAGADFDLAGELRKLSELADRTCLGPSTRAMLRAARERDIPVHRINDGRMLQLGHGARQRRINRAETSHTSAIAKALSEDKDFTNSLLAAVGVPIPEGRAVSNAQEAWQAACECGLPVVVKPREGSQGRGVSIGLQTRESVEAAYPLAAEVGGGVLVEKYAPGAEHRLLVVNGRLIAATRGDEARVLGDGVLSVAELVASQLNTDPRRGDDAACPLSLIEFDSLVLVTLEQQGLTPESIPGAGASVLVRRNGNLAIDVTDEVHPEVAARAVEAAAVVGLDVCGLDVVALDIGRPLEAQGGVIVDVNEGPGLQMHLQPALGKPRPVAEAILATLIPPGQNGRIPLVGVVGGNEAAVAARVISRALARSLGTIGRTCASGAFVGDRRIRAGDCRNPASAEMMLLHPRIAAAVFEQPPFAKPIAELGFDRCSVAVVAGLALAEHERTPGGAPRIGQAEVARRLVASVRPDGCAVLDATDRQAAALAGECAGGVVLFAPSGDDPILANHAMRGGKAVFRRGDAWVLAEGELEVEYSASAVASCLEFGEDPFSERAALAALAAAWSLNVHLAVRREELE